MRTYTIVVLCVAMGTSLLGCGGAQQKEGSRTSVCKEQLGDFTKDGDVCSPIAIEQLERDIKNWQQMCTGYLPPEDISGASDFLSRSQKCSDETRVRNAKRDLCEKRIKEMGNFDCLGKRCERALEEATELVKECTQYEYADNTASLAERLVPYFKQKIADNKATLAFDNLASECEESNILLEEGHVDRKTLLDRLLQNVKEQDKIELAREEGSKIEAARSLAVSSCSPPLSTATKDILAQSSIQMRKKRVKRKPDIWMSHFNQVEKLHNDFQSVRGEVVFPEPTVATKKTLDEFGDLKEKLEAAAADKIAKKSLRSTKKNIKKCKRLIKKATRYRAKVLKYQAAGVEKKVKAYQAKLDKATSAVSALQASFHKILSGEDLNDKAKQTLKENLLKIDCLGVQAVEAETKVEVEAEAQASE